MHHYICDQNLFSHFKSCPKEIVLQKLLWSKRCVGERKVAREVIYHCHHQPCHNSLSISSFYHLYIIFISYHNTPLTISSLFEWPFGLSSSIYQYCHPIILILKSLLFSNIFFIFTSFPRCKNSDTRDIKLNSHHRQCGCYGWLVGWLVSSKIKIHHLFSYICFPSKASLGAKWYRIDKDNNKTIKFGVICWSV